MPDRYGNRVVINGVTLYLQEDDSYVSIGDDSQLSWGIDIWCTDAHTITDLKGEPINFAKCIEIGKHVWIGKDSKIGKNVKIADNSIVGWGSIVTKEFNEAECNHCRYTGQNCQARDKLGPEMYQ